jgi:hypothetical protein
MLANITNKHAKEIGAEKNISLSNRRPADKTHLHFADNQLQD